jgi:hypothetical protein
MKEMFASTARIVSDETPETIGSTSWKRLTTQSGSIYVSAFSTTVDGRAYYGFARSSSQEEATSSASNFIKLLK